MRPCSKCLENSWKFEKLPDGWARATCQMCAATVEFEAKKKLEEGDPCRHCKEPLVWKKRRPLNQKALRAPFHYCQWLKCQKCRATYLSNDWKRFPSDDCECPRVGQSAANRLF